MASRIAGARSRPTGNSTRFRIEVGTGLATIATNDQTEETKNDDEIHFEQRLARAAAWLRSNGRSSADPDRASCGLFRRHLGRRNTLRASGGRHLRLGQQK